MSTVPFTATAPAEIVRVPDSLDLLDDPQPVRKKGRRRSTSHLKLVPDTLEARARAISAERDALDRELQDVALDLERLQEKLAGLAARGEATRTRTAEERRKLKEAQARAKEAGNRLGTLRGDRTRSVAAQRQSIDDLKALIGNVAVMVNELSG